MTAVPYPLADQQRHPTVVVAEDDPVFRLAQLLLLLDALSDSYPTGTHVERLAAFGFLAAHPLLLAREETDADRLPLLMAGFDDRGLAYGSVAHRYVTHLARMPQDLAVLVAYGMVAVSADGRVTYRLTGRGQATARQFTAVYAGSYTTAARIVVGRLRRLSDRGLRDRMRQLVQVRQDQPIVSVREAAEVDHATDVDPAAEPTPFRRPARSRAGAWSTGSRGSGGAP